MGQSDPLLDHDPGIPPRGIRAAVEDQDGVGPLAAMSVVATLRRNSVFRAAAADVLVEYAVERLADEIAGEMDQDRYCLPNGTAF